MEFKWFISGNIKVFSFNLSSSYKIYNPPLAGVNPLLTKPTDAFQGLKHYSELKHLTEADIIGFKSWKTIVIPKSALRNETTAEDVYRYILGVPKNYSERLIKEAYKTLILKWHPDKGSLASDKEFASKVFNLIRLAHDGLNTAYNEKAFEGYVFLSDDENDSSQEEVVTENAIVVVDNSQE